MTSCRTRQTAAHPTRTPSILPPASRRANFADTPIVVKNTISSVSRVVISNVTFGPPDTLINMTTRLHRRPPVTAIGILHLPSSEMDYVVRFPPRSTAIATMTISASVTSMLTISLPDSLSCWIFKTTQPPGSLRMFIDSRHNTPVKPVLFQHALAEVAVSSE